MTKRRIINVGDKFNRMTVVRELPRAIMGGSGETKRKFLFMCDCGREKASLLAHVLSGKTESCRCRHKEIVEKQNYRHGMSKRSEKSSEYTSWKSLKGRCFNYNDNEFKRYGARGITVCDRWLHSFENFYADMGPKPKGKYSIDRIDNNGNYEPSNCRWATDLQQASNKRNNRNITYAGETMCLAKWARKMGISHKGLERRLKTWTLEDAMTRPVQRNHITFLRVQHETGEYPSPRL